MAIDRQERRDPGSKIPAAGSAAWGGFTYWYARPTANKIGMIGTVTSWIAESAQVWVWKKQLHVTTTWRDAHLQYMRQRWPKGRICRCDDYLTARTASQGQSESKSAAEDRSQAREEALASFNAREAEEDTDVTSGTSSDDESDQNERSKTTWTRRTRGK